MARKADRGGLATRAKIASIASELFARDGFEGVTVSDVAQASGVSSVTVFKYFPKKEDLFFDRADEISADVLTALGHLATRAEIREGLARLFEDLADRRHPLSGLDPRSVGFFGQVAASATLTARARQLAWEFQAELEELLRRSGFGGDARMAAALIVAGYTSVLVSSAARLAAGLPDGELAAQHRDQARQLLRVLDAGLF